MTISNSMSRFAIFCAALVCYLVTRVRPDMPKRRPAPPAPQPIINHHHYYGGPGYYQNVRVNDVTNPEIAKGQYNLYTAEAVGALQSARNQSIENHAYAVENYYDNKRLHNRYEAETKAGHDVGARAEFLARETMPGRLSASAVRPCDEGDQLAAVVEGLGIQRPAREAGSVVRPANAGKLRTGFGQLRADPETVAMR